MEHSELIDTVRQTGYDVHVYFKNGFLEKVYENALVNRLSKNGFEVVQQKSINVFDEDGTVVGSYIADLLVNNYLIVEIKAVKDICAEHQAQVLAYLKGTKMKHGLLMNFGNPKFQVKKFIL